ncbi:MAG: phosphotransferase [Gammaproteobacteria bacterium]
MLDDSIMHFRKMLNNASQLMSVYFKKSVHFSKVTQLSEPDRRNVILRLFIDNPTTGMPQTLILKKNSIEQQIFDRGESETEIEQLTRFAHDWAGIEFLTQIGGNHAPHFYAGNFEYKFIIIEDLGFAHPSLVGPLTRASSPINIQEAKSALTAYVRRLGKMHADTAGKGDQFNSILKRIYHQALRFNYIPESDAQAVIKQFEKCSEKETKELAKEINAVLEFSQSANEFNVFLHGDICPDNVYYQNNQMHFIDFEFADFGNALVDSVYMRMHMPSCWCSKAVPSLLVFQMESIYREELKAGVIAAADDAIYNKQLAYACAYWLIRTIKQLDDMDLIDHEWICPSGPVDPDSKWEPEKNAFRPRILSRLEAFISCSQATGQLPKLGEASIQMLSHLRKVWPETKAIEVFPVFNEWI